MKRLLLSVIILFGVLAPSAMAKVQTTIAPPGNSGVSQYVENVPTVSGNRPSSSIHSATGSGGGHHGGGKGGGGAGRSSISPATQRSLAAQGAAGAQAAALAQATAPAAAHHGSSGNGSGSAAGVNNHATGGAVQSSGSSALQSIVDAVTGSGSPSGLGSLLPLILIITLVGSVAMVVIRRRQQT